MPCRERSGLPDEARVTTEPPPLLEDPDLAADPDERAGVRLEAPVAALREAVVDVELDDVVAAAATGLTSTVAFAAG